MTNYDYFPMTPSFIVYVRSHIAAVSSPPDEKILFSNILKAVKVFHSKSPSVFYLKRKTFTIFFRQLFAKNHQHQEARRKVKLLSCATFKSLSEIIRKRTNFFAYEKFSLWIFLYGCAIIFSEKFKRDWICEMSWLLIFKDFWV